MSKKSKILLSVVICLIVIILIGGVYAYTKMNSNTTSSSNTKGLSSIVSNATSSSNASNNTTTSNVGSESVSIEYTSEEESGTYTNYTAKIDLNNMKADGSGVTISGTTIKITSAGTYYFSGTATDANIVVESTKDDEVVIVLDNANITSTKTAVINGVKASKIIVNSANGSTNTLIDSSNYTEFTDTESQEPDSAIFSKTDLVINGSGKLIIKANYKDGIASKDGLKIVNANIEITANDDGIRGKDYLGIKNSNITINSKGDSLKATNEEEGFGYIVIDGGNINISSEDDGIHAENKIIINDGKINITKSYEGIEACYIEINGGEISVVASDDGINVAGGNDGSAMGRPNSSTYSTTSTAKELVINGGKLTVKADGDGLDSNGTIKITGGEVVVAGAKNGGNGALDYDSKCTVTGGSLIIYGANGMWQNPTTDSSQYTITFSISGNSGDKIELKDSNGNTITSFTTTMAYGMVGISNSNLKEGEKYTIYVNGESKGSQELTSIVTSNGSAQGGMFDRGQQGENRQGGKGQRIR